jgi:hypothetical protein
MATAGMEAVPNWRREEYPSRFSRRWKIWRHTVIVKSVPLRVWFFRYIERSIVWSARAGGESLDKAGSARSARAGGRSA